MPNQKPNQMPLADVIYSKLNLIMMLEIFNFSGLWRSNPTREDQKRMLLKRGTGSGEQGAGNEHGEREKEKNGNKKENWK